MELNVTCTDDSNCTETVAYTICDLGICKCDTGYKEDSGNCTSK